jgi:hypothetical protein
MSIRRTSLSAKPTSPLDIKPTPLSIRRLDRRKPNPVNVIERVRGEFTEMRGFSPTLLQAARLFDLSVDECDRVLKTLVQDGSLHKDEDGRYRLR